MIEGVNGRRHQHHEKNSHRSASKHAAGTSNDRAADEPSLTREKRATINPGSQPPVHSARLRKGFHARVAQATGFAAARASRRPTLAAGEGG